MSPEVEAPTSSPMQVPLSRSPYGSGVSSKNLSAIHGNFIPLQSSEGLFLVPPRRVKNPHRQRSHSPRRRQDKGVHLHLSLTDSQMDKLTSTDSEADLASGHGAHARQRDNTSPPIPVQQNDVPVPLAAPASEQDSRRFVLKESRDNNRYGGHQKVSDPAHVDCCAQMAYRRTRSRSPEKMRSSPKKSGHCPEKQAEEADIADTTSSVYSMENFPDILVDPLYISKNHEDVVYGRQPKVLQEYARWSMSNPSGRGSGSTRQATEPDHSMESGQSGSNEMYSPKAASRPDFSPLTNYSSSPKHTAPQKGRKIMVGKNGWLERTGDSGNNPSPPKKSGIMGTLKRMAREVAEATDIKVVRRPKDGKQHGRMSRMRTSLNPREQSLLYSELEFLLTSALDGYITSQFSAGRLDADRYKKVADMWQHKGRPRVVGFRYDLETQLELVHLHVDEFRFYGDRAGVVVAVIGILEMMKVNARAMRIRTFCQPDPVIAKQLLDSQSLFNLLGCSEPCQIQLAEVVQFFKVVLEREHRTYPGENSVSTQGSLAGQPPSWSH
ncbi:hypothetical protein CMQ_4544 [Grosmannia clavigera kw1407]|uniref:Uncharacterized protein n=1 Tax=Grosmannia clavigera (strain kw1407 / UAMH 11150) TaxID=655863 RepID=F0XTE0_GROCL|nr:uncharacterized protein CMQ_4544 [Grosmannia clavigera kw1407]EFW98692.1 hypothetical protein CMQ_4544 [Grosmannia clavigera kw1407]